MTAIISSLQSASPSSIIEVFELQLIAGIHGMSEIYRFHAGVNSKDSGNIIWAGNEYLAFPVRAEGFEYSGNGQLPRPKLQVSNILGTITAMLLSLPSGLEGAKVTRIRTLACFVDAVNFTDNINPFGTPDPTATLPLEIFFIDRKVSESRDSIEFELASAFDLQGVRLPKRQCISSICQWVYKSVECGYSGGLPTCKKTLDDCKNHFGQNAELSFGSFPGVGSYFT
jgi:lambda family phage minor tail protein L